MTTSATEFIVRSTSPDETHALGQALGRALEPGTVVALVGPLGAGKTHFVRGVAAGLDVPDPRVISSPTFVLIQEYDARLPIYHFDTYRLASSSQFGALGPDEYFEGDGVSLVEWADRVEEFLPRELLRVQIDIEPPTSRRFTFTATGARAARVLDRLRAGRTSRFGRDSAHGMA